MLPLLVFFKLLKSKLLVSCGKKININLHAGED